MEYQITNNRGMPCLEITETDEEGHFTGHVIPLMAIASWSELLGYERPADALAAIRRVAETGEPEPDGLLGENAWTKPYLALAEREQAAYPVEVLVEPTFSLLALPSLPVLTGDKTLEECNEALAIAQAEARAALGVDDPTPPAPVARMAMRSAAPLEVDPLAAVLGEMADSITAQRDTFLEGLRPAQPAGE